MPIAASLENASLDLIEELRLRRWARENYCYEQARQTSWHPVIHDEMRRVDADSIEADAISVLAEDDLGSTPGDSTILTDEEFEGARSTQPLRIGPIVPLAPDLSGLHGPHEITPPHTRSSVPADQTEMHYT